MCVGQSLEYHFTKALMQNFNVGTNLRLVYDLNSWIKSNRTLIFRFQTPYLCPKK